MASHLSTLFTPLPPHKPPPPTTTIRCGPRGNRGPLVKGRVLTTEAILAVQSLKRAHKTTPQNLSKTLSRLIKSDLLATLHELLRQNHCQLALHVLSTVRSDPSYTVDLGLYADVALALDRNGMKEDIDSLVEELGLELDDDDDDEWWRDKKGLGRLLRAVINAGRRESTVRIYGFMKRCGWGGSGGEVDEYVGRVLSKGLRRFGQVELADEVDFVVDSYLEACLGNPMV